MKHTFKAFSIISLLVLGLSPLAALAEDNNDGVPPPPPGINQGRPAHIDDERQGSSTDQEFEQEFDRGQGVGSSTNPMPGMHGEKRGPLKHFGTTTPPGFGHDRGEGSTTEQGNNDGGKGHDAPTIIGSFLNWLFGHSGTTTVADLQHEIGTSTDSTTLPQAPKGFFRSIFDRLGWFK